MDTVYIETTIIGHVAGQMHLDPFVAARQRLARDWWRNYPSTFVVYISQLVVDECSAGDRTAAAERLNLIAGLDMLGFSDKVDALASALIAGHAIPASEPRDAFHISIAAVNGVKYLLTWNFKHIANATRRMTIETICRDCGYEPPIICTPDELLGIDDGS